MKKINFIFGVHNHQPVGNFDGVFKSATEMAYEPFLDVIEKHPKIKVVFHYTGCLIDWFEANKPEFLARLKLLVQKGQAEILTGGYYEPIMPAIPDIDKAGQIKKLTDYIKKKFSYRPKGLWLAERVWEPSLVQPLKVAGVEYIILDDAHFLASGIDEKRLRGYFITEEQGITLKIFPISRKLRYIIPFAQPEESIKYLKSESSNEPSTLLVMADDGEKFGVWPDTYKTCYEKKWLEKFLTLLEENSDWINITTFSGYTKKFPARGCIYLPTASYFEMNEWSLPAKAQLDFEEIVANCDDNLKKFLKGGIWKNFLTKYSESNSMHKKMLYVSGKINTVKCEMLSVKCKKGKERITHYTSHITQATNSLYRGQCNCAYWHGIFGGLYLPHLRHAIYENLIKAENLIEQRAKSKEQRVETFDFDKDGQDEIILSNKDINIYVKPSYGGAITEIDFKPSCFNITDVLTRRFEAYHKKVDSAIIKSEVETAEIIHGISYTKELGLQKYLKYDWYSRYSLIDHFFHNTTTLEKFADCEYGELGDFVNQPYKNCSGLIPARRLAGGHQTPEQRTENKNRKGKSIVLKRDGNLWLASGVIPVEILKTVTINVGTSRPGGTVSLHIQYKITNNFERETNFWYGCEFNFALSNPDGKNCFYRAGPKKEKFSAKTSFEKIKSLEINDVHGKFNLKLDVSTPPPAYTPKVCLTTHKEVVGSTLCEPADFDFWVFPVWTVSLSEAGFEKTYQGSSVTVNRKFSLKSKEVFKFDIKISIKKL